MQLTSDKTQLIPSIIATGTPDFGPVPPHLRIGHYLLEGLFRSPGVAEGCRRRSIVHELHHRECLRIEELHV